MEVIDAIQNEDVALLEECFAHQLHSTINHLLMNGLTPLICAVKKRSYSAVAKLIQLGANVNLGCGEPVSKDHPLKKQYEETPLQVALEEKDPGIVALLLKHGAQPLASSCTLHSILYRAIKWDAVGLVQQIMTGLIEEDMYVVQSRFDMSQHLHTAVQENNIKIANAMLELRCNPNIVHDGMVPIVIAANNNNLRMCQMLMNHGAHINKQAGSTLGQSNTPLGIAILAGMSQAVKRLILMGAAVNSCIDWSMIVDDKPAVAGSSMLHLAILKKRKDIVEILIGTKADITLTDETGNSVFHVVCRDASPEALDILTYLLAYNNHRGLPIMDLNMRNNAGYTPVMVACQQKNVTALQYLLAYGADVQLKNNSKNSRHPGVLHEAVRAGSLDIVELLLEVGCSVNVVCNGLTPLHVSLRCGNYAMSDMLLRSGADINIRAKADTERLGVTGLTSLHFAVLSRQEGVLQLVIKQGIDLNIPSVIGETPLILAAKNKATTMLEILLNNGAAMNVQDKLQRDTALSVAVYYGDEKSAKILISHGADLTISEKKRPLVDVAVVNNRIQVLQMLILADAPFNFKIFNYLSNDVTVRNNTPLYEWLKLQTSSVKSLQRLSRKRIRHSLCTTHKGKSILKDIYSLPLPAIIHGFLALQEEKLESFASEPCSALAQE